MKIEEVIEECLVAIYQNDIFNETLYLKGGQAFRIAEKSIERLSTDIDFSVKGSIEDPESFFKILQVTLKNHFSALNLYAFDFKPVKRPKIAKSGAPDFWNGWAVSFKLIENEKKTFELDKLRREAIWPEGSEGKNINLEISQHEYCDSIQKIELRGSIIRSYSRALLILEKLRALCQQHPDYPLKGDGHRARDYYDISTLLNKYTLKGERHALIEECKLHLDGVFTAKAVEKNLLLKITGPEFTSIQAANWEQAKATISGDKQSFPYYVAVVKDFISDL